MSESRYSLYIVRCKDGSLYTGIATDVERRLREHEAGRRGAKYLVGRGPLTVVYQAAVGNRSTALKLEYRVKRLARSDKKSLIDGTLSLGDVTCGHDSVPVSP